MFEKTVILRLSELAVELPLQSTGLNCHTADRLVGLVVKMSASLAADQEFESRLRRDFSGWSHTSDFKIVAPQAILPGAWRYRVRTGTGCPGVNILWLGEIESLMCNF